MTDMHLMMGPFEATCTDSMKSDLYKWKAWWSHDGPDAGTAYGVTLGMAIDRLVAKSPDRLKGL